MTEDAPRTTLTDGSPVPADGSHTTLRPDGQQQGYVVLSAAERAKGFVRPYRDAYRHVGRPGPEHPTRPLTEEEQVRFEGLGYAAYEDYPRDGRSGLGRYWTQRELDGACGQVTTMGRALSETYAREPTFYGGTFCATCGQHYTVGARGEFVWIEADGRDGPRVGT